MQKFAHKGHDLHSAYSCIPCADIAALRQPLTYHLRTFRGLSFATAPRTGVSARRWQRRAKEWRPPLLGPFDYRPTVSDGAGAAGQPRTATLSPSPALRLSLILHVLADRAHAHGAHIVAEEAAAALDAPPPPDDPNDAGRIVVNIQHCLAPRSPVIGPRQRLHEPLHIRPRALGPRSLGYSADGSGFALIPLAMVLFALCGQRWAALAPCHQPRRAARPAAACGQAIAWPHQDREYGALYPFRRHAPVRDRGFHKRSDRCGNGRARAAQPILETSHKK